MSEQLVEPDGRLMPGMIARVAFFLGDGSRMTVIPRDATVEEFGLRFVYVVASENGSRQLVARRRRVEVRALPFRPSEFEVTSGLSEGQEIATSGVRGLRDGTPVLRSGDSP